MCSFANVHLMMPNLVIGTQGQPLVQTGELFDSLEMMRQNLKETLREASMMRSVAIEEEVLIGTENINKTCSNALRCAAKIQSLLKNYPLNQSRNR